MTIRIIETIDTHTLGEPTRIVIAGFPELQGRTMAARAGYLMRRQDGLRRALMWEPRGHAVMFGAIVVPPAIREAHLGLVFMDGGGTVQMCVHGTIGAVTALIETGRLDVPRDGLLVVDTPAAPVTLRIRRAGRRVREVELEGIPSRIVASGLKAGAGGRTVTYDLAYAGNLVATVPASELDLELAPERFKELVAAGMQLKSAAQAEWVKTAGRLGPWPEVVSSVIYAERGPGRYRDLVIFRDSSVDRSPCGTCFSALMAQLHSVGRLELDTWVKCENLLGLGFRGRLQDRAGELIPTIAGSAFITGEHRFRVDAKDPLRHGFQLA